MAVPGRQNGLEEEEDDGVLMDEAWSDPELDIPSHLLDFAAAAQTGDVDALRLALDHLSGSIDEPLEDGDTALHSCCLYGYLPCVKLLLERGASLEPKDEEGAIPLHDACAGGFVDIVQLLLDAAGNTEDIKRMLDTVDSENETALHHAARGEHLEVVQLLLKAGASPLKQNIYGKTPAELCDQRTDVRNILSAPSC
ncbi:uncharacterized protein LOC144700114 [Wolffia australiana]